MTLWPEREWREVVRKNRGNDAHYNLAIRDLGHLLAELDDTRAKVRRERRIADVVLGYLDRRDRLDAGDGPD